MSRYDRRVKRVEEHKPDPPPPPPKIDPEREALLSLLSWRLRGAPWTAFMAAGAHLQAHGDPEDLDAMQYRTQIVLGNMLNALDEKALKLSKLDPADKERLFVGALAHETRCELYRLLWIGCWRVENGDDLFLPPDRDLAGVFDARTGAAWNPISETDRIKEGRRLSRELAEVRERQLLEGSQPVESGQKADALIHELFDPAFGNPAQRRRRLEQLSEEEAM